MDKIDEIVDRAIDYTEDILRRAPRYSRVARDGLERMRVSLEVGAADHPALKRLESYIRKLDLRYRH